MYLSKQGGIDYGKETNSRTRYVRRFCSTICKIK
ncbi:hypothetical protein [Companilactobacillus crustorum]